MLNTPFTTTVTSGVGAADAGAASGLMNTTKQVGGALGLAVLVAVAGSGGSRSPVVDCNHALLVIASILVIAAAAAIALPAERRTGEVRSGRRS